MTTAPTNGLMGLASEDFWSPAATERARDAALASVSASTALGYAIDAPAIVDIGVRDTLPIVGIRRLTAATSAAHDFQRNGVVVAVRLDSNEVFAARAFEWKFSPKSATPAAAPSPTMTLADTFGFDLRARVPSLPWVPGTYRVYLVVLDHIVDGVNTTLTVPSGVDSYAAPSHGEPWPLAGDRLPSYTRTDTTPATPAVAGVSMVGDRVVLLSQGAWCLLQGSFRLPVTARDVPGWNIANDAPTLQSISVDLAAIAKAAAQAPEVSPEKPHALVPVTFVLLGAALTEPWVCTVVLPSWDTPLAVGDTVTGCFALNLLELPSFPRVEGTYQLWAFSGPVVAGPEPIALIPEERLAPA